MASGNRFLSLLCFFFPALANVMCYTNGIQRCSREASPCEPNCIEPSFPFPPIRKWIFWNPILGKEVIFLYNTNIPNKQHQSNELFTRNYILFREKGQSYLHNFLYRSLLKRNKDTNKKDLFKISKKTFRII